MHFAQITELLDAKSHNVLMSKLRPDILRSDKRMSMSRLVETDPSTVPIGNLHLHFKGEVVKSHCVKAAENIFCCSLAIITVLCELTSSTSRIYRVFTPASALIAQWVVEHQCPTIGRVVRVFSDLSSTGGSNAGWDFCDSRQRSIA